MPRSNRPRRRGRAGASSAPPALDVGRALSGLHRRESHPDGDWYVRPVAGPAAAKAYRCPGCDQEIPQGVAHLVAWPADAVLGDASALADRRHWHRACWAARTRRRPGPERRRRRR